MGSSSHDLGAEIRMRSFTVNFDTFEMKKKLQQFYSNTFLGNMFRSNVSSKFL